MNCYHNITIFECSLRFNDRVIIITNVIPDHSPTFDYKSIRTLLLEFASNLEYFFRFRKNLEWLTCGNTTKYANAPHRLLEPNAATLSRLALNQLLLF